MGAFDEPYYSEDEEDACPICIEEMDISDKSFKPCPCGFQLCQFCYNSIRQNVEPHNRCPACRRTYDDESIEYKQITPEDIKREQERKHRKELEKKQRERERSKEQSMSEFQAKKNLSTIRVIQKNLVYVIGLNPNIPSDDLQQMLRKDEYFGQYGKIQKIVINRRVNAHGIPGIGVYVTFARKEDAARCIAAVDGSVNDGKQLRAAYGTTKYCSNYLRGQSCPNVNCMYLHEPGEEVNTFNKKDHLLPHPSSAQTTPSRPSTSGSGSLSGLPAAPTPTGPPLAAVVPPQPSIVPSVPTSATTSRAASVQPSPLMSSTPLPPSLPPWSKATASPLPHIQNISESDLPKTAKEAVAILDSCVASLANPSWSLNFHSDQLEDAHNVYPVMFSLPMEDPLRSSVYENALKLLENLPVDDSQPAQNQPGLVKENDLTRATNEPLKKLKGELASDTNNNTNLIGSKEGINTKVEHDKQQPINARQTKPIDQAKLPHEPPKPSVKIGNSLPSKQESKSKIVSSKTKQEPKQEPKEPKESKQPTAPSPALGPGPPPKPQPEPEPEPKHITEGDVRAAMKSFKLIPDDSEFMDCVREVGSAILQQEDASLEHAQRDPSLANRTPNVIDDSSGFDVANLPNVQLVGDRPESVWSAIAQYNNMKSEYQVREIEFAAAKALTKKRMKRIKV